MNQYHAKTFKGLEEVLATELREIGAEEVRIANRGVDFQGSMAILYKANLYLRTAIRILMPVARFKAEDESRLYQKIKQIDWSAYMTYKNSFAIDAVTFSNVFRNNHYVEQKVKDAIADQFRDRTTLRPSVNVKDPEIRINIHVNQSFFTVSLDSSGASLHKRGYRISLHPAALSEVLAAGMILLTGWKGEVPLLNPMCGSGTLAIEAAMIANGVYPGLIGRRYAFQYWQEYDQVLFERLIEAMPKPLNTDCKIIASDIDREAVRITKANIRGSGVDDIVKTEKADFFEQNDIPSGPGVLLLNPPYGERMKLDNPESFYGDIGSRLKHFYPGYEAWIFSTHDASLTSIGLKPEKKIELFNGGLKCQFNKYVLFQGKRKVQISSSSD
ncbi:class I SAM-dependent RNA methyltransferase [Bacteroidota bacterium]